MLWPARHTQHEQEQMAMMNQTKTTTVQRSLSARERNRNIIEEDSNEWKRYHHSCINFMFNFYYFVICVFFSRMMLDHFFYFTSYNKQAEYIETKLTLFFYWYRNARRITEMMMLVHTHFILSFIGRSTILPREKGKHSIYNVC